MSTEEHSDECTCRVCTEEKIFLIDLICSSVDEEEGKRKKVKTLDMGDI